MAISEHFCCLLQLAGCVPRASSCSGLGREGERRSGSLGPMGEERSSHRGIYYVGPGDYH